MSKEQNDNPHQLPLLLDGLRVLRVGDCAAGGFCAQLLRSLGASTRSLRTEGGAVAFDGSPVEAHWFGLEPDAAEATEQPLATALAEADVLIDARAADASTPALLDTQALEREHPHLVSCRITPFGDDGPYRDHRAADITLYAMSGLMQTTGDGGREPLNARPRIAQISAGLYAAIGCMTALFRREASGRGERVTVSMQEAAMQNAEIALAENLHSGKVARRNGDEHALVPWRTYRCADGAAFICGGPARNWPKAAALMGDPAMAEPPFDRMHERLQNRTAFEERLRSWVATQKRRELFRAGQDCGLAWAPLTTLSEALSDPQQRARAFFTADAAPDGTEHLRPAAPFRCLPGSAGEATGTASNAEQPLAGIRVVDFTHDWAGPHAARQLAEQGAEVIKIEYPQRLDGMRGGYPGRVNDFARFWQLHANKRSVTLDLRQGSHLELCRRLIADSDIVIENSRPGVMQRLGLGFEDLRALRPDIIMLSMSAFGASGPYADYAGYGGGIEAASGLQSLTGYDADGPRYRVREMDVINGIFGAAAAAAALLHRRHGGGGQWIDLSETETCCWAIGEYFAHYSAEGGEPRILGNRHSRHAPQGCYPCAGEDRWITLCVADDKQWSALAACIGRPEMAEDPSLADADKRRAAHDRIDAAITQWTRECDPFSAMRTLQEAGIAAGVVMNAADLAADPHLQARGWFREVDGIRLPGAAFAIAGGGTLWRRGPDLGQDNDWLLKRYPESIPAEALAPVALGTAFDAEAAR